ncbi:hypothetical protein [Burkholderia gladioli]|uniref:hypothetical protein n=1 Tax=Burkholderia gladioli TaxID=28095 RepID=UPI0016418157|nr:hypothetical protein [Burkholderia gladioli]
MRPTLTWDERLHYRDRLRAARYAALADAEAFSEICFVIEAIGLRLSDKEENMGKYIARIRDIANDSIILTNLPDIFPSLFTRFDALYRAVQAARNDVAHSGVYARHVTAAAIELSIGLEEGVMREQEQARTKVKDFMVRGAVTVKPWQPVAYARQLMLTHSFTFLPVNIDGCWKLLSEVSMAKFLPRGGDRRKKALACSIEEAATLGDGRLLLVDAQLVGPEDDVAELLQSVNPNGATLWLVEDGHGGLDGVLSPFELM